jgi:hypothetical protein
VSDCNVIGTRAGDRSGVASNPGAGAGTGEVGTEDEGNEDVGNKEPCAGSAAGNITVAPTTVTASTLAKDRPIRAR